MRILKLIPVKYLVKKLPDVLAFVLTRVLSWMLVKYPSKTAKVKETAGEITAAMAALILATEDGIITKEEIAKQKMLWKKVFE